MPVATAGAIGERLGEFERLLSLRDFGLWSDAPHEPLDECHARLAVVELEALPASRICTRSLPERDEDRLLPLSEADAGPPQRVSHESL
jgi:hypothetical protein